MTKIVLTVEVPDLVREVLDPEILSELLLEKVEEIVQDRITEASEVGALVDEDSDGYDAHDAEEALYGALESVEVSSEIL